MHGIIELLVAEGARFSAQIDTRWDTVEAHCSSLQEIGIRRPSDYTWNCGLMSISLLHTARLLCTMKPEVARKIFTRLLLEKRADVTALTIMGEVALHYAVLFNDDAIVRLLLENGVGLHAITNAGQKVLLYDASNPGSESIVSLLLEKGANLSVPKHYRDIVTLRIAAKYGREGALRLLLEYGGDTIARDLLRRTPLHMEVASGSGVAVRQLLENEAVVSATLVEYDDTPLCRAEEGSYEVIGRVLNEAVHT